MGALAEDVVADTFLAAFQARRSYDLARPDARPWMFGILTRKLADRVASEQAYYRKLALAGGSEPSVDGPADRVAARVSRPPAFAAPSRAGGPGRPRGTPPPPTRNNPTERHLRRPAGRQSRWSGTVELGFQPRG